jgi:hypothetical protein
MRGRRVDHGSERHENLRPECCDAAIQHIAGTHSHHAHSRDIGRQSDGKGWKDDVERDRERELQAGEEDRVRCKFSLGERTRNEGVYNEGRGRYSEAVNSQEGQP